MLQQVIVLGGGSHRYDLGDFLLVRSIQVRFDLIVNGGRPDAIVVHVIQLRRQCDGILDGEETVRDRTGSGG